MKPTHTITYRNNGKVITIPCFSSKQAWKEMMRLVDLSLDNANPIKPTLHECSIK